MTTRRSKSRRAVLAGVIGLGLGALLIGVIAIAKNWNALAQEISFLLAFSALPVGIVAAFPDTRHHIRTAISVAGSGLALLVALFLIHFAWLTRQQPDIKIGVSLPFSVDRSDANPMYDAVKQALASMPGGGRQVSDRMREINHHAIELVPDRRLIDGWRWVR